MSAQTSYNFHMSWGCAGGIFDLAPHAIDTFLNEEANGVLKGGMAVVKGTAAGKQVKLPTSTDDVFEGISVVNRTTEMERYSAVAPVLNNAAVGVMRYGKIYGRLAADVAPAFGQPVYVVVTGTEKGCFTTASSGAMAINARFVSEANNGVAVIELQQNNIVQ